MSVRQREILLYLFGGLLFFGTMNLTAEDAGSGGAEGIAGSSKLFYRVIPMLVCLPLSLLVDVSKCGRRGLNLMLSWPVVLITWYLAISLLSAGLISKDIVGVWKGAEATIGLYWACVVTAHANKYRCGRPLGVMLCFPIYMVFHALAVAPLMPSVALRSERSLIPILNCAIPYMSQDFLAPLAALGLVWVIARHVHAERLGLSDVLIATASMVVLVVCQSRATWLAFGLVMILFAVAAVVRGGRNLRVNRGTAVILAGILACCAVLSLAVVAKGDRLVAFVTRGQSSDELESLSGRTNFWKIAVSEIKQHPVAGGGISVATRTVNQKSEYLALLREVHPKWLRMTPNLHSSVLEVLLGSGFIGGVPMLAFIFLMVPFLSVRYAIRGSRHDLMMAGTGVIILVHGIFLSILAQFSILFLFMSLFAAESTRSSLTAARDAWESP